MPTRYYSHSLTRMALTLCALMATALPAWSQTGGNNFVYGIRGNVSIGRDRASEGAVVSTNHRIRVSANSRVTLACGNGGNHPLSSGTYTVSTYCPASNRRRPGPRNPSRDPFNTGLPYVISPRNTALLAANNLTLQWNPVPNATQYRVTITGRGMNWTTTVNQPRVTYTGTASFLPDYRYNVVITTDRGLSSAGGSPMGITVLSPAEVTRVTGQVNPIQASRLEPDVEAIALALVYTGYVHSDVNRHSYALNQLALDTLQKRIDAGTTNSQIYLLQANTYLTIGLPLLAGERYAQALSLAKRNDLLEQQAQSHVGLGVVAEGQTEYADAILHLKAAQTFYQDLGDRDQVDELQTRIERLSSEVPQS